MPETLPRLAFLGIGLMGSRQVRRLLSAGYPVTVWNRTRNKAEPLAADGATVAGNAAEAVADADIVITMLENGPVVTDLLVGQGVAKAMRPGSLLIDMSSIKLGLYNLAVAHASLPNDLVYAIIKAVFGRHDEMRWRPIRPRHRRSRRTSRAILFCRSMAVPSVTTRRSAYPGLRYRIGPLDGRLAG